MSAAAADLHADVEIDPRLMRRAMGQFATGVTVITSVTGQGRPVGCTVSAFSSLSLDPPLVLVCIGKDRSMHPVLTAGPGFVVNVLAAGQQAIASAFARPASDRFAGLRVQEGRHDIPLIDGAIARIQCDLHSVLDGGDHAIVVGRVRQVNLRDGEPLLYSQGAFLELPEKDWERAMATAPHEWLLSAPW